MMRRLLTLFLIGITVSIPCLALNRTDDALEKLDRALSRRTDINAARQHHIDTLSALYHSDTARHELLLEIGEAYTGFNNDSALVYLTAGTHLPEPQNMQYRWRLASLMPLSGLFETATATYNSIDPAAVPDSLKASYYDAGRQLHSYIATFFKSYPEIEQRHRNIELDMQQKLLSVLDHDSSEYRFNEAEYNFMLGRREVARVLLEEFLDDPSADPHLLARAAHHLSTIALGDSDQDMHTYYLALSANYDVTSATREVASLQQLGAAVYNVGDIARAHVYLSAALENAVECAAPLRMIESSRSLPLIERAHEAGLEDSRRTTYYVIIALSLLMLVLVAVLLKLRHEMARMAALQKNLQVANSAKEVYISQFLQLCSIYMDKLNQFCKIATRKLAAGQADELYRMTKSGKFVEEQSREFYDVFDNAFIHIYPDFVSRVNALLRDDAKIELAPGEVLNTDLRILALMRLGIEESARIAQILNYSLNTIYSYRNRLKARALNRDTFENDIAHLGAIN